MWDVDIGGFGVQGHPWLNIRSEVSLSYVKLRKKRKMRRVDLVPHDREIKHLPCPFLG